jgi:RHS repeat-associated protein
MRSTRGRFVDQASATGPAAAGRPSGRPGFGRAALRPLAASSAVCALTIVAGLGWAAEPRPEPEDQTASDTPVVSAALAAAPEPVTPDSTAGTGPALAELSMEMTSAATALAATTAAGRTPGVFGVSHSGSATYRIPLWTPPGVGDVGLDLALVYNSRGRNGVLGQGWSLSGLSAITRCNRTWAQDGTPAAVTSTLADRYCLDGQQLKLVSGAYGAPGSVYATEIETFARIVANGAVGGGPASFTVTSKNGLVHDYGTTVDSQVYAGATGTIRTWALSRIRDRTTTTGGNSISITYVNEARNGAYTNGTHRVSSIAYPTTATGQGPYYRVVFNYTARPVGDVLAGFLAGHPVKEANQLDSISIQDYQTGATIKSYGLSYTPGSASGRLQLRSVQECSATSCLAPTTITYQQGARGWNTAYADTGQRASWKAPMVPVDLNADGLSDILYPAGLGDSVMRWWVVFAQAGGYGAPIDTGVSAPSIQQPIPGRFLGNGRSQFLIQQGSYWTLVEYTGSTFRATGTGLAVAGEYTAADIDGDGLDDLVSSSKTTPASILVRRNVTVPSAGTTQATFAASQETVWTVPSGRRVGNWEAWRIADMNGDGRADIAALSWFATQKDSKYWVTPLLSNGFGRTFTVGTETQMWPESMTTMGDWNADGCSDVIQVFTVLLSNCAGGLAAMGTGVSPNMATGTDLYTAMAADWDEDGRTDLLYVSSSGSAWHVVRSTGTGAASPVATGLSAPAGTAWFDFDANGDGKTDLGFRDDKHNGVMRYHLHGAQGVAADLATAFTDGFGMAQRPTYVSIATSNYTRHSDATFPEVDFRGPLYVVNQFTASDGTGGNYQNLFQYFGARVHLQGRGFEGFHAQRIYDSRNGLYTYDYAQRTFPHTGLHTQRSVWQSNLAARVSEWSASVGQQLLGAAGYEQRVFPYLATITESSYEVGGTLNGTLVTQATETHTYGDGHGNRTRVQRTVTDKDPGSPFVGSSWQSTTTTTYANDTAANCRGLPTSTVVTRTAPGQAARTRTATYTVDTATCRVTQQVLEPNTPSLKVTTTPAFDACGNVSTLSVVGSNPAGSAMPARTTSFGYGSRCQLPETVTNPLGHVTRLAYQYHFGMPLTMTDPNGLTTRWQYDEFGRRVLETRPDQTSTSWSFESCTAGPCWGVNDLRFHVYETSRGSAADTYGQREFFYDGFDRPRSRQHSRVLGVWTTETVQYDSLGRPVAQYRPYSSGGNGYVAWSYDALDRVVAQKLYQSSGALDRSTTLSHSGRSTHVTDALGRTRTHVVDVAGQLRQVTDPGPGGTTHYDYDSFGGLVRIQDPIGAISTGAYNVRGFRTQWADADRGNWTFSANSLNELVSWKDARGQSFSVAYDALGRVTSRTEPEGTSTWTWGTTATARNIGRLQAVSGYGYAESRAYDAVGRLANRTITTDQAYAFDYSYNSIGALDTITYPTSPVPTGQAGTRFKVKYAYSFGAPSQVTDVTQSPAKTLWTLHAANDDSAATAESFGANLVSVASGYRPWTGELTSRQAGVAPATANRQNLAYQWDAAGNLTQRQDLNQALVENFTLDGLDRIVASTLNGVSNLSVAYDAAGNVTSRSDVGVYSYGDAAHRHAVTAAGSRTFAYDANGNQVTRDGVSQSWASFNLPTVLRQPIGGTTYQSQLTYGPDHQRWKQVATYSNGTETTLYVGGLLEKESTTSTGKTYWRHYVHAPSGLEIVVSRNSDASTSTRYVLADHLGSSDALLDGSGNVAARESFGAFGSRRGSDWKAGTAPDWASIANSTRHGYTGHEHLDNVALIHMNGRVFDPLVGRFLSVDPLIGELADSQQVNPYAYAANRPLSLTDPSGYDVVCGGACAAVVASVVQTAFNYLAGGDRPEPPPATALPGQSAQSGMGLCGPGTFSPTCAGMVLYAGAPGVVGSGVPSSSWGMSGERERVTRRGFPGEPGASAASVGLILAQDPDIPTKIKLGAPIVLAVGTGAGLLCLQAVPLCGLIAASIDLGLTASSDVPYLRSGPGGLRARQFADEGTEIVERAMSRAELNATRETGLLRGGRAGTHYVSDSVNSTASGAQRRLALPTRPDVRVRVQVPGGRFSEPSRVAPYTLPGGRVLPGGGMERKATGEIPVRILGVEDL